MLRMAIDDTVCSSACLFICLQLASAEVALAVYGPQGACLHQVGQMDLAGASVAPLAPAANGSSSHAEAAAGPSQTPPAQADEPASANGGEQAPSAPRVISALPRRPAPGAGVASAILEGLGARGLPGLNGGGQLPGSSGKSGHSTENEVTGTEEERARHHGNGAGALHDPSFASCGAEVSGPFRRLVFPVTMGSPVPSEPTFWAHANHSRGRAESTHVKACADVCTGGPGQARQHRRRSPSGARPGSVAPGSRSPRTTDQPWSASLQGYQRGS